MKYVGVKTTGELRLRETDEVQTDKLYMAVEDTKIGASPIKPYQFVKWDGTKWVKVDNVGLATTLDTKNIEDALAAAAADLQDKIDEVTLDPSAVALGNVHLLDEVTKFPADGCILIDSETNGPGEMPKDTLLELTAQNALESIHSLNNTATEADLVSSNCLALDGSIGTKKLPANTIAKAGDLSATIESVRKNNTAYSESMNSLMTQNKIIYTDGGIGSVVDYTEITNGGSYCIVVACNKGDVFKIKGTGGSSARLWCFVDSSDKIVEVAATNTSESSFIYKTAPANGKLICNYIINTNRDLQEMVELDHEIKGIKTDVDSSNVAFETTKTDIYSSINKMSSAYTSSMNANMILGYYINTSGGVGSVVDYTPVLSGGWYYIVLNCCKGDVFKIKGTGGSAPRLWCFVDSSDKIVEVAEASVIATDYIYKIAPADGKLIYNCTGNSDRDLIKRVELDAALNVIESGINEINNRQPMVNLEIDREKFDPTPLLSGFDFTNHANYTQSIYTLFEALVSSSNGLVTSFDVAEYADETYPAYVGDETLKCYKVSKNEAKWGNSGHFVKKKILIIGGTHGNEKAAPFNCYILAWRLLNDIAHKDVFSLLDAFDFYIVPCLNLYGLANNSRYNGNGVDLNRNSNYPGWHVSGTPFNDTYTGPSADSEYETRCIHAIVVGEEIDFLADHHNYASNGQFYTETRNKEIFLKSYDALKEVSLFCIKNWPEYFGDKFQLVKPISYGSASPEGISSTPGTFEQWAYFKNIYSMTIEMNQGIVYDDGVPDESYTGRDAFGATAFSVGEFTLRCQLVLYGQLLMPQVF